MPVVDQPENYLDTDITANEIIDAVRNLKNNKASGIDGITNEYIKASIDILLPVYVKLFNIIYDQGTVPIAWTTGIIKPIYKFISKREISKSRTTIDQLQSSVAWVNYSHQF